MFAVIRTGGKQYRVAQNDILAVERLDGEPGATVGFDRILAIGDGDAIDAAGDGATVKAEILEHRRAARILVFKKKRRKKYRRRAGHRQQQTVVRITEILAKGAKKPAAKKPAAAKTAKKPVAAKAAGKKAAAGTAQAETAED